MALMLHGPGSVNPPKPAGSENPSAAFLAGHQHGTALAVKHAAAVPPPKAPPKPPAKPPASPVKKVAPVSTGAATLNQVLAQAKALAASDTSGQVDAYKAQQDTYTQQAQDRASQINLASQAAAKFLAGLGDQTTGSYNTAAQVLAGIAGGYSGDLKNTATDAASQVQAQLAGLGAPAAGLKTSTGETANPEALQNVLYGLGGAIPANLLVTSGQAAAAAQRGLPASTLGYGQQQAAGTIAAGQQQADQLSPQILAAIAGQPKLAQQYLSSIQSQATDAALANSLIDSRATSGTIAQQNANTAVTRANNAASAASQRLALQKQNYNLAVKKFNTAQAGGGTAASKPSSSITKSINDGFLHLANGQRALVNGQPVKVAKTGTATSKPYHGLSAPTYQKNVSKAQSLAAIAHQPTADGHPPVSWLAYLRGAQAQGIPTWIIIQEGRKIYSADEIKHGLIPGG